MDAISDFRIFSMNIGKLRRIARAAHAARELCLGYGIDLDTVMHEHQIYRKMRWDDPRPVVKLWKAWKDFAPLFEGLYGKADESRSALRAIRNNPRSTRIILAFCEAYRAIEKKSVFPPPAASADMQDNKLQDNMAFSRVFLTALQQRHKTDGKMRESFGRAYWLMASRNPVRSRVDGETRAYPPASSETGPRAG